MNEYETFENSDNEFEMNAENTNTMYLVTGAAGFLGGTVCRQLIDRGDKVRAFVLPNDPAIKFVPEEAELLKATSPTSNRSNISLQSPRG